MKIKNKQYSYKVGINAALGSFYVGYQIVTISSIEQVFGNANHLNQQQTQLMCSLLIAALPFSAIIGAVLVPKLMNIFKGIKLMIILDIISICLLIGSSVSLGFYNLLLCRLGIGFTAGVISGFIPKYLSSISPLEISTSICSLHHVMGCLGMAISYLMCILLNPNKINNEINWRVYLCIPILPLLIRSFNLLFCYNYEIIGYNLNKKQSDNLRKYFDIVYYNSNMAFETLANNCKIIKKVTQQNKQQGQQADRAKQRQQLKYLIICCVLVLSNQCTGVNSITYYARQIFLDLTNHNQLWSKVLCMVLSIIQTIAALSGGIITDKLSKKRSLIIGQLIIVAILFSIFLFEKIQIIAIILIMLHIFIYSYSIGQLFSYYAVNMLDNPRNAFIINWFLIFVITLNTQTLINIGLGYMCLIFSGMLSCFIIILIMHIPSDDTISDLKKPLQMDEDNKDHQLETTDESEPKYHMELVL